MSSPTPVAAIVDKDDRVRSLISAKEPDVRVTPAQLDDKAWLARLLTAILRDVAQLLRRAFPRRIDFEDRAVNGDGTTEYSFHHGLNNRVRWWVADSSGGFVVLQRSASSTNATLVLTSFGLSGSRVTVRIEEAG